MKKDEKMTKEMDKNSIEYLKKIEQEIQEKIRKIDEENGEFDEEFYKSGLTKSQREMLKEVNTFASKEEEQEYYEWRWKDEIENDKRIEELAKRKENEIFEIVKNLEKRLDNYPKIDEKINEINNDVLTNLDKYYEQFIEYKTNFDKVSQSSVKSYKSSLLYLKYFTDDNTILNFSFFKDIQKKLQESPSNFFKYDKYYKKSFDKVLELKKDENYDTLSSKTINNHMSNFYKFFDHLIYQEIIKENPLDNIKSLKEEESEKIEYTQEDVIKIFESDMEIEYKNLCKFGLYTGLRIQEILSVQKEDIKDNLIHITLEDSSHKKHERIVPVHKNIIDIVKFQTQHNKSKYLFFDFSQKEEPKNVSKRVNRRLKKIINEENKTFHSFRKNFSQEIELNTNSDEKTKKYLMGHSFKNDITHTVYNKNKINIEKLQDCINQITFNF